MITVVVPVYNLEQFLPRCMNSLLSQTSHNFEIILVDDGSADGSGALCDEYVAAHPSIVRCIHKTNGGLSSARNAGINAANGDYVIFPDPDDWVEPNYLEHLSILQAQYHADLVCTGHYIDYDTKSIPENPNQSLHIMSGREAQSALLIPPRMSGFAWNKLYQLDIIRENNLQFLDDVGTTEDLDFAFRYLQFCNTVCFDPSKRTYHYYQRSGAATRCGFSQKKLQAIHTYEKILRVVDASSPIAQAAREEICNTAINLLALYLNADTQDTTVYQIIRNYIRQYYSDYLKSEHYGGGRKVQAVLARHMPRLYGMIKSSITRE